MHPQAGQVVGEAGDRGRVATLPLGRERLGLPLGDGDRCLAGLHLVAEVEDRPVVGLDLGLVDGGDLGEQVAGAVDGAALPLAGRKLQPDRGQQPRGAVADDQQRRSQAPGGKAG